MRPLIRSSLIAVLFASTCRLESALPWDSAENETGSNSSWDTHVFQIRPNAPWWEVYERDVFGSPAHPGQDALPASKADKAAWIKHIQRATAAARKEFGIAESLPQGTAFLYDDSTGTLVVRTIKAHLPGLRQLVDEINDRVPRTMSFQLYLLEGPAAEIQQIIIDCRTQGDHSPALAQAFKGVDEGRWKMLAQPTGEVRPTLPGQTAAPNLVIEAGPQWYSSYAGEIYSSGEAVFQTSPQPPELLFEADPLLRKNTVIDLYYNLRYQFAPPRHWFAKARHLPIPQASAIQLPMVATHSVSVATSAPFSASQPRLLSVWTPTDQNGLSRENTMQIAFLVPQVRLVLPPINEQLKNIFLSHVDEAESISSKVQPPPPLAIPEGMAMRHFKVPSDFFQAANPSFSPATVSAEQTEVEAKKVMEASGITFPEGARARYNTYRKQLTVINTSENLDAIEAYTSSLGNAFPIKELTFTADIFQAEASLLRPILANCTSSGDHHKGQLAIETLLRSGQAQMVESLNLTTRTGMRGVIESGQTIMMPAHVEVKLPEKISVPAAATPLADTNATPMSSASEKSEIDYDTRLAGTRLEIDPLLSQDQHSVDVRLEFEYHYAPPEMAASDDPLSEKEPVKFHQYNVKTTTMVPLETSRILGVWKPEGSPAFAGKDLLQVAFFRIDLRLVNPPDQH